MFVCVCALVHWRADLFAHILDGILGPVESYFDEMTKYKHVPQIIILASLAFHFPFFFLLNVNFFSFHFKKDMMGSCYRNIRMLI